MTKMLERRQISPFVIYAPTMASRYIAIAPHLGLTRQSGMHMILSLFQAHRLQRMLSICKDSTIAIITFRGSLLRGPSLTLPQAWADLGSHIYTISKSERIPETAILTVHLCILYRCCFVLLFFVSKLENFERVSVFAVLL